MLRTLLKKESRGIGKGLYLITIENSLYLLLRGMNELGQPDQDSDFYYLVLGLGGAEVQWGLI